KIASRGAGHEHVAAGARHASPRILRVNAFLHLLHPSCIMKKRERGFSSARRRRQGPAPLIGRALRRRANLLGRTPSAHGGWGRTPSAHGGWGRTPSAHGGWGRTPSAQGGVTFVFGRACSLFSCHTQLMGRAKSGRTTTCCVAPFHGRDQRA